MKKLLHKTGKSKTKNEFNYSLVAFIIALVVFPLLLFVMYQKTQLKSRAASYYESFFDRAAQNITDGSGIVAPPLLPVGVFTVEGRFKLEPFTSDYTQVHTLFMQGDYGSGIETSLWVNGNRNLNNGTAGTIQFTYWDSFGPHSYTIPESLFTTSQWHHVALVRSASDYRIFLDGKMVWAAPYKGTVPFTNSQDFGIGCYVTSPMTTPNVHDVIYGSVDEVRISNIARYSDSFVPSAFPFKSDDTTVALYHFNGMATDASLNKKDATIVGTITYITSIPIPMPTKKPTSTPKPTKKPAKLDTNGICKVIPNRPSNCHNTCTNVHNNLSCNDDYRCCKWQSLKP